MKNSATPQFSGYSFKLDNAGAGARRKMPDDYRARCERGFYVNCYTRLSLGRRAKPALSDRAAQRSGRKESDEHSRRTI